MPARRPGFTALALFVQYRRSSGSASGAWPPRGPQWRRSGHRGAGLRTVVCTPAPGLQHASQSFSALLCTDAVLSCAQWPVLLAWPENGNARSSCSPRWGSWCGGSPSSPSFEPSRAWAAPTVPSSPWGFSCSRPWPPRASLEVLRETLFYGHRRHAHGQPRPSRRGSGARGAGLRWGAYPP